MDSKIFLGKYRVGAEEIEAVGEVADSPLAYEAEEIDSGKKVIVEVVPAGSLKKAVRERLESEAMAAKKLSHVNIPALYDFGVEEDHLVYVTEDFEGTLAEAWVNAHGPLPVGPVLRIAAQVVSAMGAAAHHGIVHHAINPSNLVLVPGQTAEGEWPLVKVLHFVGVAPKFSGTDVAVAAFDKSLHYASPEQIQKGTVDFRSEIYSLGSTMWFLLTGAPPLAAHKEPLAAPSSKAGLVEEKVNALPKKARRLLTQMLSANPDERPGDPLAFYRTLQDCLHQVERRETMSPKTPKSGVPAYSSTLAGEPLRPRRNSLKTLARAAICLGMAAAAAFVIRGYLQHRRIVRAEEPIGVPIGVSDAVASATPVNAQTITATTSSATPATGTLADSAGAPSGPAKNAEPDQADATPPATNSLESRSTSQIAVAPAPPAPDSPPNPPAQQEAPVTANAAGPLPGATASSEVDSTNRVETALVESASVEANAIVEKAAPKKTIMREVRRAERAEDEPEVRRAEPAPPEEGPESAAPEAPAPVARTKKSRRVKRTESGPEVSATPGLIKREPTPKPKRPADIIYLPVPVR